MRESLERILAFRAESVKVVSTPLTGGNLPTLTGVAGHALHSDGEAKSRTAVLSLDPWPLSWVRAMRSASAAEGSAQAVALTTPARSSTCGSSDCTSDGPASRGRGRVRDDLTPTADRHPREARTGDTRRPPYVADAPPTGDDGARRLSRSAVPHCSCGAYAGDTSRRVQNGQLDASAPVGHPLQVGRVPHHPAL